MIVTWSILSIINFVDGGFGLSSILFLMVYFVNSQFSLWSVLSMVNFVVGQFCRWSILSMVDLSMVDFANGRFCQWSILSAIDFVNSRLCL